MKKCVFIFIFALLLIFTSHADVIDNAELLSNSEENALAEETEIISDTYAYDVVILTVKSLNGKDVLDYADNYYDYNNYKNNGMIFVISMSEREFATSIVGNGIYLFSDYTIDNIHENITQMLSDGYFYDAFLEYIDQVEYVLYSASLNGEAVAYAPSDEYEYTPKYDASLYTYNNKRGISFYLIFEFIVIAISILIGFIVVSIMKAPMKNTGLKKHADTYIGANDLMLTRQTDRYMYSNITKTKIQTNHSSSGNSFGGGSSSKHIGSSGRTHGGRSGRF